jgi:hypothetical protein
MRAIKHVLILGALLTACGDSTAPQPEPSLTLSTDSVSVFVGGSTTVTATVANTSAQPQFTTRNSAVALVSMTGTITGVSVGATYVVASAGTARDSVKVQVVVPGAPTITLSADSVVVLVGASTTVNASTTNTTGQPAFVTRNQNVATVQPNGSITGVSVGTTYVVATVDGAADSVRVRVATTASNQPVALPVLGVGTVPERYTAEVAALGNVAYTTTWGFRAAGAAGNAIKIWNVSGSTPILADSIILTGVGTVSDIQISDDGALVVASLENSQTASNNGLAIFDRANPTRPQLITRFSNANTTSGVHTVKLGRVNGRHYAFLSINSGRLSIVDITNPAAPVEVFTQALQTTIHDVFIRDGLLFAALWGTGLRVYDVGGGGRGGTISAPVALGTIVTKTCKVCGTSASVHNVWWFHDPTTGQKKYAFVGEEGPGGVGAQTSRGAIHVVDVTDFANMKEVAVYEADPATSANQQIAGAHNFVMDEASGILYAAYYNAGVRALDVRGDLSVCTAAQKTPDGRCDLALMGREVGIALSSGPPKYVWGVARVGSVIYASDMINGLYKIDISGLSR